MSTLYRYITDDGSAFIHVLDGTEIVQKMESIFKTSATASAALGRTLLAASLMGSGLMKDGNTLTLTVKGNGPIGSIVAVSDWRGNVRGYCDHPQIEIPLNDRGKLDVGTAVGRDGSLTVIKDLGMDTPYVGSVPLTSGEIAEDIASYYAYSEQVPTVCALGVLVAPDLSIRCAGGFLLQLLPGADEEVIDKIEENLKSLPTITAMLEDGLDAPAMAQKVLTGFTLSELDHSEVHYQCTCSRSRMEQVLISLGKKELENLAMEQDDTEIVCHFCQKKYHFSKEDLLQLSRSVTKENNRA